MARKKKYDVDGQISFDLSTNTNNQVVQANELIMCKQTLSLNAAKLMRTIVMQIKPDDDTFKLYHIGVSDLAKMFGVPKGNLYRDIVKITKEIFEEKLEIKSPDGILMARWVTTCKYTKGEGLTVRINEDMRPFLLGLKEHYTQYVLENILQMKSPYAIRIYEMLVKDPSWNYIGVDIDLKVADIRRACDCEDKLKTIVNLKEKVLDVACREINRVFLTRTVSYDCIKNGRSIETIRFHITR